MVFRVEKNKNYTVMSNHHLSNMKLSLKAKGLMSLMLSLPEDWDYTLKGLARICKDGVDSIGSAVNELEAEGYIIRNRTRDERGKLTGIEYVIHECPQTLENADVLPKRENPVVDEKVLKRENPVVDEKVPKRENPVVDEKTLKRDFPVVDFPDVENPPQSNTKYNKLTNVYNNIYNQSINLHEETSDGIDMMDEDELRDEIKYNIEYATLISDTQIAAMVDEIVELIYETLTSTREEYIFSDSVIKGDVMRYQLRHLRSEHILYVINSIRNSRSQISNIKKYTLRSLYNARLTYHMYINKGIDVYPV